MLHTGHNTGNVDIPANHRYFQPDLEVRSRASQVAVAEEDLAREYLRLVASGIPTWQAQKMADLECGRTLILAKAEYEIALARLHGSTTS